MPKKKPDHEKAKKISISIPRAIWNLAEMQMFQRRQGDSEYIRELIDVQHGQATEFTWNLLVRVLRCQCEPLEALNTAQAGLLLYPESADLQQERAELQAQLGDVSAFIGPVQQRQ